VKSPKTTWTANVSSFGTTLAGVGTLSQFIPEQYITATHKEVLFYVAAAGFVISAIGKSFFGAAAQDVKPQEQADTGDTTIITKP
jgi:hypothetical protein